MWRARSLTALVGTGCVHLCLLAPAARGQTVTPADSGMHQASAEDARRGQVLAHGKGVEVTVGEVEDLIAQQGPGMRARYRSGDTLKALVSSLVRAELLANEAERRGYEAQPPVRYLIKDSAAQALMRSEVDEKITPEAIAPDEVRAYYDAHPSEFHRHAMRRASQIILDGEAEAVKLLPEAQKADPRAFAELAKQHSKDSETKPQGGDLGYFAEAAANDPPHDKTQPMVQPRVRSAVFALADVGDTSPQPIELDPPHEAQRAIVRFSSERPERHVALDDAQLTIRAKLWRERRQKALDQLYGKLRARDKPQVFTERIYLIDFDDMEKRPSGFVPDPVTPPAQKAQQPAGQP